MPGDLIPRNDDLTLFVGDAGEPGLPVRKLFAFNLIFLLYMIYNVMSAFKFKGPPGYSGYNGARGPRGDPGDDVILIYSSLLLFLLVTK